MERSVDFAIKSKLCIGCGTCISLCPDKALKLKMDYNKGIYFAQLDEERCTNCTICHKICPVLETNFGNKAVSEGRLDNMLIGNYVDCYTGYATDRKIRYESASGGLITQLLIFALETGMIDGALVTRMREDDPLKSKSFIARTKKEIVDASGSKYCPVSANIALSDILKEKGKFAVVGLPCHIRGIRKAERINRVLRERIVLHLGLFCNHTPTFWATELFLQRMNVKKEDVTKLDYRGEGWPGVMRIFLKNGRINKVAEPLYWSFLGLDFFIPRGCLLCSDGLNELADLSFGDAWLPEFSMDNLGTSVIIVRRSVGKNLIRNALESGKIELFKVSYKKIIQSQLNMIYFKKKNVNARSKLLGLEMKRNNNFKPTILDIFFALFTCFNSHILSKPFFRYLLKKIPMSLLLGYYFIPNRLYSKMTSDFKRKVASW